MMNFLRPLFLFILSITFSASVYCSDYLVDFGVLEPTEEQHALLEDKFSDYLIVQLDPTSWSDSLKNVKFEMKIDFKLGREHVFNITLEPSRILSPDYFITLQHEDGETEIIRRNRNIAFKGFANGDLDNIVRLTVDHNFVYGYIHIGEKRFFIEPLRFMTGDDSQDLFIFYEAESILETMPENFCAAEELEINRKQMIRQMWMGEQHPIHSRADDCYVLDYAIASDWLMFNKYGQDVDELEMRNIGVTNNVQGNYTDEFEADIQYNIVTQFISTCSTCDPWTNSNEAGTLLGSFRNWGNGGGFGVNFGNGTLWTNRNLAGSTIGIAYLNGICNTNKYNVNQDFSTNQDLIRVLLAHELGHNWSATHDAAGSNTIMAPAVNNTNNWSNQSFNQISGYIANRANIQNCLEDCPPPDPPMADFFMSIDEICPGNTIHFYDISENSPTEWNWSFPGGTPSFSTDRNPSVTYNQEGVYDVTLTATNLNGSNEVTIFGAVFVSGTDGYDVVLYDDFDDTGLSNWTIDNPDNGITWVLTQNSYMPYGTRGVGINNHGYTNIGQKDALISQEMDFTGREEIFLELEYAYRRHSANRRDSLNIYLSFDGGQTFPVKVFGDTENGNGNFATLQQSTAFFLPQEDSDWCVEGGFGNSCLLLDISQYNDQESVVLKIENVTGRGNNMFINRVMVFSSCQITDPPTVSFDAWPTFGCAPLTVEFFDNSFELPISWNWTFPGGDPSQSTEENPVVTYNNQGSFDVTLEVANIVGSSELTVPNMIAVDDVPIVDFSYEINILEVSFFNNSQNANSYFWEFGDGNVSVLDNPVHTYALEGEYEVRLFAFNDCGESQLFEFIFVLDYPEADFSASEEEGCAPLSVQFFNESSPNVTDLVWSFPGGNPSSSTSFNPTVSYTESGVYDVELIVFNDSGSDTIFKHDFITVFDLPEAEFNVDIIGDSVFFDNLSSIPADFLWKFGDGNSSSEFEPVHAYENDGEYEVVLVVSNLCGSDTASLTIEFTSFPIAAFATLDSVFCSPAEVTFVNQSTNNVDSVIWIFEGGNPELSNEDNPVVTYENAGFYDVTLIVFAAAGSDTLVMNEFVEIKNSPEVEVSYSPNQRTIQFETDLTFTNEVSWDFGDGNQSAEENPEHTFEIDGDYLVTLYAINECDTTIWQQVVQAYNLPSGDIGAVNADGGSELSDCAPFLVHFIDRTEGIVFEREWIFEGGSPETSDSDSVWVEWNESGTYSVTLIVSNPAGSDTVVIGNMVEILPIPVIDFDTEIEDRVVSFIPDFEHVDGLEWSFGDGSQSTEMSPIYTYENHGIYTVRLVAWNQCDTVSLSKQISVGDFPLSDFTATSNRQGCAPFKVQFENNVLSSVDAFEWTFEGGIPETSNEPNPEVTYNEPGVYSVSLRVVNALGSNTLDRADYILVDTPAVANFEFIEIETGVFEFHNLSNYSEEFEWDFGDGSESDLIHPEHEYAETGVYIVRLIASNYCSRDTFELEVNYTGVSVVDYEGMNFTLYPNPTSGNVILKYDPISVNQRFNVFNSIGQLIKEGEIPAGSERQQFDFTEFPSGMYQLVISTKKGNVVLPIQLFGR
ncbi:MAG: PKD domain-containing protein [Saprospirales bacterium]|nr:MAG: PKD domain-containing protein [Saprospirales bacterium]